MKRKGFTIIELIMVIIILGILAVVAFPRFFNITGQADTAAEQGVVGGVRAGIQTSFAQNQAFPAILDASAVGACTIANPCFDLVLSQGGITTGWTKDSATQYTYDATAVQYTYTAATGNFQ